MSRAFGNKRNLFSFNRHHKWGGHQLSLGGDRDAVQFLGQTLQQRIIPPKCNDACAEGWLPQFKSMYHGIFQRKSTNWKDVLFQELRVGGGGKQASGRCAILLSVSPEPQDHPSPINKAPAGLPPSYRAMLPASKRKEALPISEPCVGSQHKRGKRICCPDGSKLQPVQGTRDQRGWAASR